MITQIGRDSDRGFLRMVRWKDLKVLVKKFEQNKEIEQPHLGISIKSSDEKDGLIVVRITVNSPFS